MKQFISFLVLVALFISCKPKKPEGIYEHGRIEYKITYLNEDNGSFDPALLPKKMVLDFNEDFSTNSIDGFMGFFRLGNLTYFGKKKSISYLKVLNKTYIFQGSKNELMCCFNMFEDMTIEHDTITKTLAGLKSYHAKAVIPNTDYEFDIFYTYDIKLHHPNITNPYRKIDGVLTDFVLFMGPYEMRFVAKKFIPEKSPKEDIGFSESAHQVTREEMIYALERLMEQ